LQAPVTVNTGSGTFVDIRFSGRAVEQNIVRYDGIEGSAIIMLTAKTGEADRVAGLDLGAGDYITKPFSVRELMARVRAVLRRVDETGVASYEDESLQIDYANMHVTCQGAKVKLTRKEFALLSTLARSSGRVATRQRLLNDVGATSTTATSARWTFTYAACGRSWGRAAMRLRPSSALGYRFIGCSASRKEEKQYAASYGQQQATCFRPRQERSIAVSPIRGGISVAQGVSPGNKHRKEFQSPVGGT
jgi:hypothetical protein